MDLFTHAQNHAWSQKFSSLFTHKATNNRQRLPLQACNFMDVHQGKHLPLRRKKLNLRATAALLGDRLTSHLYSSRSAGIHSWLARHPASKSSAGFSRPPSVYNWNYNNKGIPRVMYFCGWLHMYGQLPIQVDQDNVVSKDHLEP